MCMKICWKGHTRYTEFRGDRELRAEIAKFYEEEYGFHIDDTAVYVTASGTHAMCLAFCAIFDPGDEVIVHGAILTLIISTR